MGTLQRYNAHTCHKNMKEGGSANLEQVHGASMGGSYITSAYASRYRAKRKKKQIRITPFFALGPTVSKAVLHRLHPPSVVECQAPNRVGGVGLGNI